jgi:hypothetical protein
LQHNWTTFQDYFLEVPYRYQADTRLNFTPDRVQHWVMLPNVQTGSIWLFGIFHYILNWKVIFKNENFVAIQADFGIILLVLLLIRGTELDLDLLIFDMESVREFVR